jgi:hypothetical protein
LAHGIGHSRDQAIAEPGARALQVARDGATRVVDHAAGVQPDPHHGGGRGHAARQTAAPHQLHRRLPIRIGVLVVVRGTQDSGRGPRCALPHAAGAHRHLPSRRPPRSNRAARTQTPSPRLQTHARAPKHSSRTTNKTQLTPQPHVTMTTVPFIAGAFCFALASRPKRGWREWVA